MLPKNQKDIESIILRLSKKNLSANEIRKRLKPIFSKNLLPSIKVYKFNCKKNF